MSAAALPAQVRAAVLRPGGRGSLCDCEREDELHRIEVPTLITCGEFDGASPQACRHYASLMPDAEVAVVDGASHFTFVEKPEEYLDIVRRFLTGHDL